MAVRISISEIISGAASKKSTSEKVDFLRSNDTPALRVVLKYTYDNSIEFLIPDTPPPWNKNEFEDEAKALLYREARRLKIFVKGGGYDTLNQIKRETLFINLLEDVDNDDAETLCQMITKKPFKGLTKKTIQEAFADLIEE
tara:strand:+ start:515 stop:940 length:426 start_codon:yes stop_codon:yes gene_type:complete